MSDFSLSLFLNLSAVLNNHSPNLTLPRCRCTPEQDCYPSKEPWNIFNNSVGGRLLVPRPTAWPCYSSHYVKQACNAVKANFADMFFRSSLPGSMENWYWEERGNQQCSLEKASQSDAHCDQGRIPSYGVQVTTVADIQKTILFAAQKNLRLFVKSTGHEYAGRSSYAPGSFLLWLHKFQSTSVNMSYVPTGCTVASIPAVTVAGGTQWRDVVATVSRETNDQYVVVGGQCPSVGAAGGYVLGGGHGVLSPLFGLAVDSVLQFELVTADGQIHVANQCRDPELFWALRGGGGGTFGVVSSVTYKLHPAPKNFISFEVFVTNIPDSKKFTAAQIKDLLLIYTRYAKRFDDARWGGYLQVKLGNEFGATFLIPNSGPETNDLIQTFISEYEKLGRREIFNVTHNQRARSSFQEWYENPGLASKAYVGGIRLLLGGRLIPLSALEDPGNLAAILTQALSFVEVFDILIVAGEGVRENDVDSQTTSVHPSWREAFIHTIFATVWPANMPESVIATKTGKLQSAINVVSAGYPEAGEYFNEAYREKNWQETFWGTKNYQKLLQIKKRVDPHGLFTCIQCVGSEEWDESGNCRSRE